MSEPSTYRWGLDVGDDEVLHDSRGHRVADAPAEAAAEEAIAVVRGRGRPSLSSTGESPLLRVRIPRDLDEAVRSAARRSGTSRSEWVRRVLDDAARRAG